MLLDVRKRRQRAELVIGLVGPVGSNLKTLESELTSKFTRVGYRTEVIHLIELLHEIDKWKDSPPHEPEEVRILEHMDAGDTFRDLIQSNDALAVLGVGDVQKKRATVTKKIEEPASQTVYILKSLKHSEEAMTLREIYGPGFLLLAAYSPRDDRVQELAKRIAESHNSQDLDAYRSDAEKIVSRDLKDATKTSGQEVRKTFPEADVFFQTRDENALRKDIARFVELLLGSNDYTPSRDEHAMFLAQGAALRSGALGRQVGAVLTTTDGDIITAGTNEVPRFGGGQYWEGDPNDERDIRRQYDSSDQIKRMNVADVIDRIADNDEWLLESKKNMPSERRTTEALRLLEGSRIMQPLEFGRAVHAEMAAIVGAARRGVSVQGATLYTTTFPCHECARHIIGAGIIRVVYIEPYPKSLAAQLHEDSIAVEATATVSDRVRFEPFIGIAPKQYAELFTIFGERKTKDGKRIAWQESSATLRLPGFPESYIENEKDALELLRRQMEAAKLKPI